MTGASLRIHTHPNTTINESEAVILSAMKKLTRSRSFTAFRMVCAALRITGDFPVGDQ